MVQKRGLQYNKTNIYLLSFRHMMNIQTHTWKGHHLGSQRATEQERVAIKQNKYSPSLLQQSSIAITQAWQKREGKSSKPGVSEIAIEQKRGLPQNNTNIYLLHRVHQSSPACEALV